MHQVSPEPIGNSTHTDDVPISSGGLTDAELAERGLVKIQAFARAQPNPSGSASRTKRARDKAAANGARQLNIVAPVLTHTALRNIARDLQAGSPLSTVLNNALAAEQKSLAAAGAETATVKNVAPTMPITETLKRIFAIFASWISRLRLMTQMH